MTTQGHAGRIILDHDHLAFTHDRARVHDLAEAIDGVEGADAFRKLESGKTPTSKIVLRT